MFASIFSPPCLQPSPQFVWSPLVPSDLTTWITLTQWLKLTVIEYHCLSGQLFRKLFVQVDYKYGLFVYICVCFDIHKICVNGNTKKLLIYVVSGEAAEWLEVGKQRWRGNICCIFFMLYKCFIILLIHTILR